MVDQRYEVLLDALRVALADAVQQKVDEDVVLEFRSRIEDLEETVCSMLTGGDFSPDAGWPNMEPQKKKFGKPS